MVAETLLGRIIDPEALALAVVVQIHGLAGPVLMALDPEVVVTLGCQLGQAGTRLQDALRQRNAGRDAGAKHFRHGNGGIGINVLLLGSTGLLRGYYQAKGCSTSYQNLLHLNKLTKMLRY